MHQGGADPGFGQNYMGNFMNDPNAQMMGQIGKSAMMTGAHYMEQNVRKMADLETQG